MKELNRLTPDGAADFYGTEAWPDDVSGVAAPVSFELGYLVVSIVREQQNWKLFFKTLKGEKGVLILTIPATATYFDADIEDVPKPERQRPWAPADLYKEVRLEGNVRGTGIFAKGMTSRTKYRLVLQQQLDFLLFVYT
jgi:hypothetical protein